MCRSWWNAHHAQDARKDQEEKKVKMQSAKGKRQNLEPGVPSSRVTTENQ